MDKLYEYAGLAQSELFMYGVELEVENAQPLNVKGWAFTSDGSLRDNGVEFIFDGPAHYDASVTRITALAEAIAKFQAANKECFTHSTRTSVHIHTDITTLDIKELRRMATIYMAVERPAFKKWGAGRDSTPYCVPLSETSRINAQILTCRTWERIHRRLAGRMSKYCAFSLCRCMDLGTAEFRLFNGTNDPKTLISYLRFVSLIRGAAVGDLSCVEAAVEIATICELDFDFENIVEICDAAELTTAYISDRESTTLGRGSKKLRAVARRNELY